MQQPARLKTDTQILYNIRAASGKLRSVNNLALSYELFWIILCYYLLCYVIFHSNYSRQIIELL